MRYNMKKITTLLVALCLFAVQGISQVIYETNFLTQEDFATWTVVDVNEDGTSWTFDEYGDPSRVFYSYHAENSANDWIISPAITPEVSGTVAISFIAKGSSYVEKLQLFVGNSATVAAMTTAVSEVLILGNEVTSHLYFVDVEAGTPFHLGYHASSDANAWRLYINNIKVQATSNPVDLRVSEFLSPVSDFNLAQETVTIKVKNEGRADVNGFDVTFMVDDIQTVTEQVSATLAIGQEMEYTFTAKADLSTPRISRTIKAWTSHPDELNASNDTCSTTVLHKAEATVPYKMGFEANEYTDGITLFNLNEDEGNWDLYTDPWWNLAHTGDYCLAYNYDKNNNGDDWAILEPIKVDEPGYYVMRFWYSGDDTHPEKLAVYYGNEGSPSAMTQKIVEYAPFARSAYEESINILYIEEPQTIYFGFHAFSDKDENWLCVDDVVFEKISGDDVDLCTAGFNNPTDYVHNNSNMTASFNIRNLGIKAVTANVVVKIDEANVANLDVELAAQEIKTIEIQDLLATISEGLHTMVVEVSHADDKDISNNTDTIVFNKMGKPFAFWNFEDGQLPAEFVFRSQDEGTVHPSAGEEFNEAGWGIFNISTHALYGEHVLAGTSWLEGTNRADRWCVLPPVTVGTGSQYLVWDVASFNPNFLETYSIMISNNGDDDWYYFTAKEFTNESANFKTRGVEISGYNEGDTLYVAFRIRSKNCEHLILDNIGLYGAGVLSSVKEVATAEPQIMVANNTIMVAGTEVKSIQLYDTNGRLVAETRKNSLAADQLNKGIYFVKVITDDSVVSKKVIIK